MKHWLRWAGAWVAAAVLLAGPTGRVQAAEAGAPALQERNDTAEVRRPALQQRNDTAEVGPPTLQERMETAREAAPEILAAAAAGDLERFRTAYDRFAEALDPVLPAVSMQDPGLAARMANASSTIRGLLLSGILSEEDVAREVAVIRDALEEALRSMPRADEPARRFTVVAREYRFQPAELRARAGSEIVVRLENRGRVPHEFRIPELNVLIGPVEPGRSAEAAFTVEKPGTYSYECRVDGHYQRGMRGRLVVE